MNPWHIGCQVECLRHVFLALGVGQLLATRTTWVALSAVTSEDPTKSTSEKEREEQRVCRRGRWKRRKMVFIDVKEAHLNGKVIKGKRLFGMRLADQAWEEQEVSKMVSIGCAGGKLNLTVFRR